MVLNVVVHRAGSRRSLPVVTQHRSPLSSITMIFADAGYQGRMAAVVAAIGTWKLEIVKRKRERPR